MSHITHDQIAHMFPGIQDHTVVEILDVQPTESELEATLMALQGDDRPNVNQPDNPKVLRMIDILRQVDFGLEDDR